MARFFVSNPYIDQGELVIEEISPVCVEVFYFPPRKKLFNQS